MNCSNIPISCPPMYLEIDVQRKTVAKVMINVAVVADNIDIIEQQAICQEEIFRTFFQDNKLYSISKYPVAFF